MTEMIDPITRFERLMDRAVEAGIPEPTAMALATATSEGRPSVRMVLLKNVDERGFVFYTNLESRKSSQLMENPHAALCFHWPEIDIQVRVEGVVEPVTAEEADAYFASRSRGSRIGAWASRQSRPLASRTELEARVDEVADRFGNGPIPRPPFWSGFRIIPDSIEFWTARPDRLHERELYTREREGSWTVQFLFP